MPAEVRFESNNGFEEPPAKRRAPNKSTNVVNPEGTSECFRVVRTTMYVSLAPCYITNPINGIKAQHLDPLIMTYFPKADGVVLSYSNLNVSKEHHSVDSNGEPNTIAKVSDSSPFSFLWVNVDLLIWRPQIGDVLEGYIYMQTASHIGLLVHDTFNASIRMRNIPQDWEFVPSQADEFEAEQQEEGASSKFRSYGYWADAEGTKVEGKITFTVRSIHTTGKMMSLEGTLVPPESELDAQPVFQERRGSNTAAAPSGKHMKFDEEPAGDATEGSEPKADVLPTYEDSDVGEAESTSSGEESSD